MKCGRSVERLNDWKERKKCLSLLPTHLCQLFHKCNPTQPAWPATCNLEHNIVLSNICKTKLTYNCAHLRLNNKKNKNKLSQSGPLDWTLILDKKWFDQFFAILDHFWKKIFFGKNFSEKLDEKLGQITFITLCPPYVIGYEGGGHSVRKVIWPSFSLFQIISRCNFFGYDEFET